MTSLFLLLACHGRVDTTPVDREAPAIEAGEPLAGVAEGTLDFPMGAPLGGYTSRCNCFGNGGEVDKRDSAYVVDFNPSAGVQTRPRAAALWLEAGNRDLVVVKADLIYASDDLAVALEEALSEATGLDLEGSVVLATSHTHHAPANWHPGLTWWLGGDRENREVRDRLLASLVEVALAAWEDLQPAALGLGIARNWDPDDLVYSDRRPENDELGFLDDVPDGPYKDPTLTLLRVDAADGTPLGVFFAFGIHGTVLDGDNEMWSTDAPGAIERRVEEAFDTPVVVAHWQGGAGDASPRGSQSGYARLETIGEYAVDAIVQLWADTPTTSEAVSIESVTHALPQSLDDIVVTRGGTVDWRYTPYEEGRDPDDVVFDADGSLASPIDEFNAPYGAAFCGYDDPLLPGAGTGSEVYPYNSCVRVDTIASAIAAFFDLPQSDLELPLPESTRARATAARIGPLPVLDPDGTEATDDVLLAFFPGEPTALYSEWFRRRAASEIGREHAVVVGYAQDHEGYLLVPEDWLQGGYEPNINVWGPLQGEYILERVLDMADRWLSTDVAEPQDPEGRYPPTDYPDHAVDPSPPDGTPDAGTALKELPEYIYQPIEGLEVAVSPPAEVPRVQGVAQFAWIGGDPAVDLPTVTLQRLDENSVWQDVTTPSGRPVTSDGPDILLTWTPDPLYPAEDADTHLWWAAWQAVGPVGDRAGVPIGTYRLLVEGHRYTGGGEGWPWPSEVYRVASPNFIVTAAEVSAEWDGTTLSAWIEAPDWGWRLVDMEGDAHGDNPLVDPVVTLVHEDGAEETLDAEPTTSGGRSTWSIDLPGDVVEIRIADAYGNEAVVEDPWGDGQQP